MPSIYVITKNKKVQKKLKKAIKGKLGEALQLATARTFGFDPEVVGVGMIALDASRNVSDLQMLAIGSYSKDREELMETWRSNLKEAWQTFHWDTFPDLVFSAESWPILPIGTWEDATLSKET